jgi:hypothetical protein
VNFIAGLVVGIDAALLTSLAISRIAIRSLTRRSSTP